MKELTIKDYKLRLILLNEWKSKTSVKETKKIVNERLGKKSIKTKKVQKWFKQFDNGETSIFDKKSPLNVSVQNRLCDPLNSLLFLSDEKYYEFKILKYDERFIEYFCRFVDKRFIALYDLFLGVRKKINLPAGIYKFEMIDDGFLLALTFSSLHLIKIDYENLTHNLLNSFDLNKPPDFIRVDQLNFKKFVVFTQHNTFAMGEVENDKILLNDFKNLPGIKIHSYYPQRLVGQKFQYFDFNDELKLMKIHETNLNTMEKSETDVPFVLENDDSLEAIYLSPFSYCWFKNRLYKMFPMNGKNQCHLLMFNLDELKWTNIQIVINTRSEEFFVNSNDTLVLQIKNLNEVNALYRIPLRKPDKLENLARLFILRQSTLLGNDSYLKRVRRIPMNSNAI